MGYASSEALDWVNLADDGVIWSSPPPTPSPREYFGRLRKFMFDARVKEGPTVPHVSAHALRPTSKWAVAAFVAFFFSGCRGEEPQLGSQTNWLLDCETSADCGGLECICGTCTLNCSGGRSCASLESASCIAPDSPGAVALCGGQTATSSLCAVTCEDGVCPLGSSCLAGVCSPDAALTASLTIDPGLRFQALVGFGAGLAVGEEAILSHPQKSALLDALFVESGLDIIRLENRYQNETANDLTPTQEIIAEAATRLGKRPTVFLYSDTPPANLKANGSRECTNFDLACTLGRNADGGFDYAGFASYWSSTLTTYSEAGITPDYVSIQSNTDWLPGSAEAEACRLLPQEGIGTVRVASGEFVEAEFAGYLEALAAVKAALDPSISVTFAAPEVGSSPMVAGYTDVLDPAEYGALAFHLYGEIPIGGSLQHMERIGEIAAEVGLPAIQSEMDETGLNTAVLVHHTLVTAGGGAYLQRNFIVDLAADGLEEEARALIGIQGDSFRLLPPYHALAHFAQSTDEGWLRVSATFDSGELLASAWVAPDDSALTIVLINPTTTPARVELRAPLGWEDAFSDASVTRTVFDGVERSAPLGTLDLPHGVEVPGHSTLTIAAEAQ